MVRTSGLAAIHPGEFLAEILAELGVSQAVFARAIGVSPMRVSHVIGGSRPVTAELALLFGKALDQSPEYWLNLQSAYDLAKARSAIGARLKGMQPLPQASPAERMKAMRERRRRRGLRELRLVVPDAASKLVRRRVAKQVAALDQNEELDALKWIETVSESDRDETR
jgi:antitoxin HigA-1